MVLIAIFLPVRKSRGYESSWMEWLRYAMAGEHGRRGQTLPTPSMEDYIEQIYILIEEKGYARVSDIAEALSVHPSSVTKMVQKLDKDEYLVYEKYRGLVLTPREENWPAARLSS
jgi:hypothetical protein